MDEDALEDDATIELSSIAAIFPELVIDPSDPYTATLDLPVTPLKPLRVHFPQPTIDPNSLQLITPDTSVEAAQDGGKDPEGKDARLPGEVHELEELPPLKLRITLPRKYPAEEPPRVNLLIDPPWLSRKKLDELTKECVSLWEDMGRDQVVYSYIDYLQQQAETAFGLADTDKPATLRADIKLALLDYDLKTKRDKFEKETFDCGICLEPKKGKECHRLLACRHVFCIACLQDSYNTYITEGDVDGVKCLNFDCGKADAASNGSGKRRKRPRTLNPSELLQIPIKQELVQRYVRLKRKKRLESKKSTIYCPRPWCQAPAWAKRQRKRDGLLDDFSDSESEAEVQQPQKDIPPESIPMSQRLAICEDCDLAFCIVCKKGWHGERVICNPRKQMELDAEELATMEYIKRYSTPCPTCSAPAQKTMGCNHMICAKCKTHFCYLCSAYLMPDNPYRHFNDFKSTCFQRLWELEGGDGEGAGHNYQGIGGVGNWEEEFEAQELAEAEDAAEDPAPPAAEAAPQPPVDDDTDDEEPAPDIRRRERAIEIVNFARGAQAQRILLPEVEEPHEPIPPPAPVPPRPRGRRRRWPRQGNPNGPVGHIPLRPAPAQHAVQRPQPVLEQPAAPIEEGEGQPADVVLPRAAPGQGRADGHQPAPARAMGLDRFLELAQNDREDEWDSDELGDDLDDDDDDDEDDRHFNVNMNRIDARNRALLGMQRGIGRGLGEL
jgi:E3 ubiquitin-protein ligase RNF14